MHLPRRQWLQQATLAALATQLPRWAWSQPTVLQADPFALGVASGDPTPDGVVLWTRLQPSAPGSAPTPLTVHWELAHDAGFRQIVQRGQTQARPEWGHSVHVELQGLAPDRWYHYRFHCGDATSATGRTRTAPAADALPARLRLAFASCQRWEHGHYAAWRQVVADAPDLVLFLGDYIYEYATPKDTTGLARVHNLRTARTLADYRDRYALHKSDPLLQAAHAACPWVVTWDDHEVQNDYAGAQGRDGDTSAFTEQRLAGWQAFYENMPLRASSLAHGVQALQIYRTLSWGRLAQFQVLDTRQYRDWQACRAPGASNSKGVQPAQCAALADPQRSLLGMAQEHWLEAALARNQVQNQARDSGPRWSVIAQQTLFSPRRYPSGVRSTDSWEGYPAARDRLLQALQAHPQRNTVFLGGDIHQNYVCNVPAPGADPEARLQPGDVLASEFCGTSLTSHSGTTQAQVDAVARHNPHVLLARCEERGYSLAEVTPRQWQTTKRAVNDPLRADSAVRTLARFVVDDGRPGPQRN
jgi:alkaline phosphatase D